MNSDTFNRFIDTLFTILDRLEKEYSAEDVIKEFKKVLKKAYFTEGAIIRDVSEEEEKEMIHNTELKLSKQEGFAEGKAEGKVEGKAEGKVEGKAEVKVDVIKNAIAKNIPIETIAYAVNLSVDDVNKIIKENKFDKTSE